MNPAARANRKARPAGVSEDELRGIGPGYRDAGDGALRIRVGHGDSLQAAPGAHCGRAERDAGRRQSDGLGDAAPVPVNAMLCGELAALSVMVMAADNAPVDVG